MPCGFQAAITSGDCTASRVALPSLSRIAFGVPAGAIRPNQIEVSKSGMPDFETSIWFGLMAPAGTPKAILDKLGKATREAVQSPDVIAAWKPQGIDPLSGGPDQFARYI